MLFPGVGYSQIAQRQDLSQEFVVEKIWLHTDRALYISGETLWFKLYVCDAEEGRLTDFSKVGYLELIGQDGIAVSQVKTALENGQGAGTIKLPKGMPHGYYTLRAYTQGLRNLGEDAFARQTVIVLNPEQPLVRVVGDLPTAGPAQDAALPSRGGSLQVEVQTAQPVFAQRSLATLEITTKDAGGRGVSAQISLAVALPPPADELSRDLDYAADSRSAAALSPPTAIVYAPETEGMCLQGRVVNQNTKVGEPKAEVYLAFPGKPALVYAVETDEAGLFSFLLPKLYGLRPIVVQVRPKGTLPLVVELADEFHPARALGSGPFVLPPEWAPVAQTALINARIGEAYQAFAPPPLYALQNPFDTIPFFGKADARYFLDDYTRFPLPEFFFEIVPEVRVRGKFGNEELKLLNEWENEGSEAPPLLLVDGVPVFDQRTFLKINNHLIASTEVVVSPFWLNPVVFDGIVQISSFEGDARCFALPPTALRRSYLALLPQQQCQTPDYEKDPDSRLPDFRTTLYWNPTIETNAEGKAIVQFYTSDVIGEYDIHWRGVSAIGLLGSGRGILRVTKADN